MKKSDFIDAIHNAGWVNANDAQHENIAKLWEKLFPVLAELERENEDLIAQLEKYAQQDERDLKLLQGSIVTAAHKGLINAGTLAVNSIFELQK